MFVWVISRVRHSPPLLLLYTLGTTLLYFLFTCVRRYIDSNNRKALTYSLAVNHMTDFSNDELKMMRGYRHTKGAKGGIEFTSDISVDLTPNTWDWRIRGLNF